MFVGVDKYARLGSRCLVDADEMKKEVDADGMKKERKRLSGGKNVYISLTGSFSTCRLACSWSRGRFPRNLDYISRFESRVSGRGWMT